MFAKDLFDGYLGVAGCLLGCCLVVAGVFA